MGGGRGQGRGMGQLEAFRPGGDDLRGPQAMEEVGGMSTGGKIFQPGPSPQRGEERGVKPVGGAGRPGGTGKASGLGRCPCCPCAFAVCKPNVKIDRLGMGYTLGCMERVMPRHPARAGFTPLDCGVRRRLSAVRPSFLYATYACRGGANQPPGQAASAGPRLRFQGC